MKKILAFLTFAFLALNFTGCGDDEQPVTQTQNFKEFAPGEEISLKSVVGKELTLVRKGGGFAIKGAEDKTIMFDIFGTFCQPCKDEAPSLMEYQLKNAENFTLIALTHFENVTDKYVVDEFMKKFHGFYFISNDQAKNDRIIEQITRDIDYKHEIALPFKVVLKDGVYQTLTDVDSKNFGVKYYLGGVKTAHLKADLEKIVGAK